uniref:Peroxidase 2 n=1 Tax=Pinctada fucata TaxID=50426 RepID=A0A0P0L374_PINFU|nr:peroxidase 2 [Pinctada fucata]
MDVIPAKACDPFQRYRETDGQCNNLFYRSEPNGAFKLGAAFTAQGRFLFPDYDNVSRKYKRRMMNFQPDLIAASTAKRPN